MQSKSRVCPPSEPAFVLRGHHCQVSSVRFASANGEVFQGSIGIQSVGDLAVEARQVCPQQIRPHLPIVASGDLDGVVIVWNLVTRRPLLHFIAHLGSVLEVWSILEGRLLLTQGKDGTFRVWDIVKLVRLQVAVLKQATKATKNAKRVAQSHENRDIATNNEIEPVLLKTQVLPHKLSLATSCIATLRTNSYSFCKFHLIEYENRISPEMLNTDKDVVNARRLFMLAVPCEHPSFLQIWALGFNFQVAPLTGSSSASGNTDLASVGYWAVSQANGEDTIRPSPAKAPLQLSAHSIAFIPVDVATAKMTPKTGSKFEPEDIFMRKFEPGADCMPQSYPVNGEADISEEEPNSNSGRELGMLMSARLFCLSSSKGLKDSVICDQDYHAAERAIHGCGFSCLSLKKALEITSVSAKFEAFTRTATDNESQMEAPKRRNNPPSGLSLLLQGQSTEKANMNPNRELATHCGERTSDIESHSSDVENSKAAIIDTLMIAIGAESGHLLLFSLQIPTYVLFYENQKQSWSPTLSRVYSRTLKAAINPPKPNDVSPREYLFVKQSSNANAYFEREAREIRNKVASLPPFNNGTFSFLQAAKPRLLAWRKLTKDPLLCIDFLEPLILPVMDVTWDLQGGTKDSYNLALPPGYPIPFPEKIPLNELRGAGVDYEHAQDQDDVKEVFITGLRTKRSIIAIRGAAGSPGGGLFTFSIVLSSVPALFTRDVVGKSDELNNVISFVPLPGVFLNSRALVTLSAPTTSTAKTLKISLENNVAIEDHSDLSVLLDEQSSQLADRSDVKNTLGSTDPTAGVSELVSQLGLDPKDAASLLKAVESGEMPSLDKQNAVTPKKIERETSKTKSQIIRTAQELINSAVMAGVSDGSLYSSRSHIHRGCSDLAYSPFGVGYERLLGTTDWDHRVRVFAADEVKMLMNRHFSKLTSEDDRDMGYDEKPEFEFLSDTSLFDTEGKSEDSNDMCTLDSVNTSLYTDNTSEPGLWSVSRSLQRELVNHAILSSKRSGTLQVRDSPWPHPIIAVLRYHSDGATTISFSQHPSIFLNPASLSSSSSIESVEAQNLMQLTLKSTTEGHIVEQNKDSQDDKRTVTEVKREGGLVNVFHHKAGSLLFSPLIGAETHKKQADLTESQLQLGYDSSAGLIATGSKDSSIAIWNVLR